MITIDTFFWFYNTLAQVAAAIVTLIGVFFITYYSIIRPKQLDKEMEDVYQTQKLGRIMYFRYEICPLFKHCQEIFSEEPSMDIDQANEKVVMAKTNEEAIEGFKEICRNLPSFVRDPIPNEDLENYMKILITFSNTINSRTLIEYLKEENPKLTDEEISKIKSKKQGYERTIEKIEEIRREIKQNEFENHFPNRNKIKNWIIMASLFGVVIPLSALLALEWFLISYESYIRYLTPFSILLLFIFIYSLYKLTSLIIEDMTSKSITWVD